MPRKKTADASVLVAPKTAEPKDRAKKSASTSKPRANAKPASADEPPATEAKKSAAKSVRATPATTSSAKAPAAPTPEAKAVELDEKIDAQIKGLGDQLAKAYLAVGAFLKEMRDTGGHLLLGHETWEAYLDSKKEYGRTYLSYLYKLGQAEGLDAYLAQGMSGTKLIEFAKRTDYPEKIPALIEATWEEVKDSPVRETAVRLGRFVAEHPEFKREKGAGKGSGRPRLTLQDRLEREWAALGTEGERDEYVAALRAFTREKRPRKHQ